jgi:ABC-type phosphate transport system substrate-binding protein
MTRVFKIILFSFLQTACLRAEPVFVANSKVPENALSSETVDGILKGRIKRWPNGGLVRLATLKSGDLHETVLSTYAAMNVGQFSNNWRRIVFSGNGSLPQAFSSEQELVSYVANTDGALGYVDSANVGPGVKVIKIE